MKKLKDIINSKNEKLTEEQIRLLWHLHEAEQLKEKLSPEDIKQINNYIRKGNKNDMWEIK